MADQEPTSENKPLRDEKGRLLPGYTANPAGRPKETVSITELIRRKLKEKYPDDTLLLKRTYAEMLTDVIFEKAIKNKDNKILKDIWSYMDGMPKGNIALDLDKEGLQELTELFRQMGKKDES